VHHIPPAVLQLASRLATLEASTTAARAANFIGCSTDQARDLLRAAAASGLMRRRFVPGFGNEILYQPTARAAGLRGKQAPKFLRAGFDPAAVQRGLLRGAILFSKPDSVFIPAFDLDAFCSDKSIPVRGHARPLLACCEEHSYEIFAPVLAADADPVAQVACAISRWFPLLETGSVLRIVCFADVENEYCEAVSALLPAAAAQAELVRLDAEIAADKTGVAAIKNATRRAVLAAEAAGGLLLNVSVTGVSK